MNLHPGLCQERLLNYEFVIEKFLHLRPVFRLTFQAEVPIERMDIRTSDNSSFRMRTTLPVGKVVLFDKGAFSLRILQVKI